SRGCFGTHRLHRLRGRSFVETTRAIIVFGAANGRSTYAIWAPKLFWSTASYAVIKPWGRYPYSPFAAFYGVALGGWLSDVWPPGVACDSFSSNWQLGFQSRL